MRGRTLRGVWLLAAVLTFAPVGLAPAQQYAPADPQIPLPYGSTRPEDGGLYFGARALLYRQTNPLRNQQLAIRGFLVSTPGPGSTSEGPPENGNIQPDILGNLPNLPILNPANAFYPGFVVRPNTTQDNGDTIINGVVDRDLDGVPDFLLVFISRVAGASTLEAGAFYGSGTSALDVEQLRKRNPYQPGTELSMGYKFGDGSSVTLSWLYLTEVQQRAGATLAPPGGAYGPGLDDTFLYSPVYNFPPQYAGADWKIRERDPQDPGNVLNDPQTVFGIWNGASIMTIEFRQRFQQWDITYREPIWETENYRLNGLVGPRYAWIWEKFKWVTTSIGQNPDATVIEGPQYVGVYSNITSNRMYGVHAGCEQEWYLGRGFAVHLKTEAALYLNSVKERAKYETAAKYLGLPENKTAKREWSVVPELQANLGLMWYPTEFVQVYAGYDVMYFMNTIASPRPVDFDYSGLNPRWTHVNRLFDGWNAGIALTF